MDTDPVHFAGITQIVFEFMLFKVGKGEFFWSNEWLNLSFCIADQY